MLLFFARCTTRMPDTRASSQRDTERTASSQSSILPVQLLYAFIATMMPICLLYWLVVVAIVVAICTSNLPLFSCLSLETMLNTRQYKADGLLKKNNDSLHRDLLFLIAARSTDVGLRDLLVGRKEQKGGKTPTTNADISSGRIRTSASTSRSGSGTEKLRPMVTEHGKKLMRTVTVAGRVRQFE